MQHSIRQAYRHLVQQQIVHREMRSSRQTPRRGMSWNIGGIVALFSTAAACGTLAQFHLG